MKKTAITIVVLMCSQAFGLSFMGAPMAELEQGQYSFGIDYSFSDTDVELSGYGAKWTEDIETNILFSNLNYGITDEWEGFLRLGFANVEADDFNGDNEFAYGFGTKITFSEQDAISWGALLQISWLSSDDSGTIVTDGHTVTGKQEIDIYEIQIAIGPTYETDDLKIYGGPFLHLVSGDYDWSGTVTGPIINGSGSFSLDIEQESVFGGYIGISKDLTSNSNIGIEFQYTGDAQAVGVRYVLRF